LADPELVEFIQTHISRYGEKALRARLLDDGVSPAEIDEALSEARPAARSGRPIALFAVFGGAILLVVAGLLSMDGSKKEAGKEDGPGSVRSESADSIFRGHFGYLLRLPPGYRAEKSFADALKLQERVIIFKKGTDRTHFYDEGMYGYMGIFKLDVVPRRVPQGMIGIDALRAFVTRKLEREKAAYTSRALIVHNMPAFIITQTMPDRKVQAYIVGQKVHYKLTGGESEDLLFTSILSSLAEVSPHDRPGR